MTQKNISLALIIPVVIIAIIFILKQFISAINWDVLDFVVAYLLLEGLSIGLLFIATKVKPRTAQIILGIVAIALFGLIWAQLAVGIFS